MFDFFHILPLIPACDFAWFSALVGLFLGSFYNVCIDRTVAGESVIYPPSHCEACHTRLRPWELVPVLSWMCLRGRCSHCGARVSWQYPFAELLSAALAGLLGWTFGPTWAWLAGMIMTGLWFVLAGIDCKTMMLPDRLTLTAAVLAWPFSVFAFGHNGLDALAGGLIGAGLFWLVGALYARRCGRDGLGFGDVKLMLSVGALSTAVYLPLVIMMAGVAALSAFAVLGLRGRSVAETPLPFGPFLTAAGWVTMLAGDRLCQVWLDWVL